VGKKLFVRAEKCNLLYCFRIYRSRSTLLLHICVRMHSEKLFSRLGSARKERGRINKTFVFDIAKFLKLSEVFPSTCVAFSCHCFMSFVGFLGS
jgi:hypothetical protein